MQKNAELVRAMMDFAENHTMVGSVKWIKGEGDLENFVYSDKTIIYYTTSANLDRSNGRPVYEMNYVVCVVDKGALSGELGMNSAVDENLFVLGQLQDYLIQEGFDIEMLDVDIQTDYDDAGSLVVTSTNLLAYIPRNSVQKDINI